MIRGSVTASLIGYALLMHVKEFGQLLIEISSLLEKISRGLYYERMKLSYLCTAEYVYVSLVAGFDGVKSILPTVTRNGNHPSFALFPRFCIIFLCVCFCAFDASITSIHFVHNTVWPRYVHLLVAVEFIFAVSGRQNDRQ